MTCQGNGPRCHEGAGTFLLPQLKNASTINRSAVSVYLGPNEPKDTHSELILGAAYDKAKIDGELFTVKMVDPFSSTLTDDSTNYANVTSIEADIAGKHAKQTYGDLDLSLKDSPTCLILAIQNGTCRPAFTILSHQP